MMPSRLFWVKTFAFLSLIRWYNLVLAAFFSYAAAHFLLRAFPNKWLLLTDFSFHFSTLGLVFILAAGYLINAFYDAEKDLLDRPQKVLFERFVSKATQLRLYFFFNGFGVVMGGLGSWKVGVLFFLMSVGLYFYSHKFQKKAIWGELMATLLTVGSIGWVAVYFERLDGHSFLYGGFLGIIILIRELVKGMEGMEEEKATHYETVATRWGSRITKGLATVIWLGLFPLGWFLSFWNCDWDFSAQLVEGMEIFSGLGILFLWFISKKNHYRWANNYFKILMLGGLLAMAVWR
ncbi:MAG: geranylgeranylglycerol-phosphate geranylgeranyltransferase [Bacteroidia bacterium]|jgi:4-hydroxybenzoate polyprenyltransferase